MPDTQPASPPQRDPAGTLPVEPVTLPPIENSQSFSAFFEVQDAVPLDRLGRFVVDKEIGRGGMGLVLRGHDPLLGRELALKVLLDGSQNTTAVRRFYDEAQIAGQLQHPGLVPVYELGVDENQRPFFAMKLVNGRTLSEELAERGSPAERLPHFLTIFEQICQAIGYAHSRGVIHRDLKPSNVMVGAFGEVQVMDWGLAKILDSDGAVAPDAPAVRTGRVDLGGAVDTQKPGAASSTGAVLGTPAYLPPEQARAERLDCRADVFGLGGILCEILTSGPPLTGATALEMVLQSGQGELSGAFERLDACGADAELVQLAKGCLAPDRAKRPPNGSAVAERVAAYRAGVEERLHRSELERAAAEGRTLEERRRRRTQMVLGTVVLLFLIVGGAGGWYVRQNNLKHEAEEQQVTLKHDAETARLELEKQQERVKHKAEQDRLEHERQQERNEKQQEKLKHEAELARLETKRVREEAERRQAIENDFSLLNEERRKPKLDVEKAGEILSRIEGRLAQGGGDEWRQRIEQAHIELDKVRKDHEEAARLEEINLAQESKRKEMVARLEMAMVAGSDLKETADNGRRFEQAFEWYRLDVHKGTPAAVAAAITRTPISEELVVALDEWAFASGSSATSTRDGTVNKTFTPNKETMRLWDIADAADNNARRREFRSALRSKRNAQLLDLANKANLAELPPPMHFLPGHVAVAARLAAGFVQSDARGVPLSSVGLHAELEAGRSAGTCLAAAVCGSSALLHGCGGVAAGERCGSQ